MIRSVLPVVCLLLASCAQPEVNGFDGARVRAQAEQPMLRIGSIRGPSNAATRALRDAIARGLKARGVDVVRRRGENILELTGTLAALNEGSVTGYTYEWRVSDRHGPVARPIVGIERSQGASSDMWSGVAGATAARIGARVARSIAITLGRSG